METHLVEKVYFGLAYESSGKGNELTLTLREVLSSSLSKGRAVVRESAGGEVRKEETYADLGH